MRLPLLLLAVFAAAALAINNGVGRTPAMGWNTWCTQSFDCVTDFCTEQEVMAVADGASPWQPIASFRSRDSCPRSHGQQRHARRRLHLR